MLRHRGKSPRQASYFFKNNDLTFEAVQLASLFLVYGLLRGSHHALESRYQLGSIESGTLFCQVYEAYLEMHEHASISFEHAWFLLMALARRDELAIVRCTVCGGVRLRDLLSQRRAVCGNCEASTVEARRAARRTGSS